MHPEATADPQVVRWHLPEDALPGVGRVLSCPKGLETLRRDGLVTELQAEPASILIRLATPYTWRGEGARVRTALRSALDEPQAWRMDADGGVDDQELRRLAESVLEAQIAPLAAAHGGRIELVDVVDGLVRVRMHGACHGCPAADDTLGRRFEEALRAVAPQVRGISPVGGTGPVHLTLGGILRR